MVKSPHARIHDIVDLMRSKGVSQHALNGKETSTYPQYRSLNLLARRCDSSHRPIAIIIFSERHCLGDVQNMTVNSVLSSEEKDHFLNHGWVK